MLCFLEELDRVVGSCCKLMGFMCEAHQPKGSGRRLTLMQDHAWQHPSLRSVGYVQKWYNTFGNHDIVIDGANGTICQFQPVWRPQCSHRVSHIWQAHRGKVFISGHLCPALYLDYMP